MGDSLGSSTSQKIDADGRATYEFEGHVLARGLDLDASAEGPVMPRPDDSVVTWTTPAKDRVVTFFGYQRDNGDAGALLEVDNAVLAGKSARVNAVAGGSELSFVSVAADGEALTVIDGLGQSDLVRQVGLGAMQLDVGQVELDYVNGFAAELIVPHSLGVTPFAVIVSNQYVAGVAASHAFTSTWRPTNFRVAGIDRLGAFTGQIVHSWLAIAL